MERLEAEHFDLPNVSLLEHRHRYLWASQFATGTVCDIACGAGYGSAIISAMDEVDCYHGLDLSEGAVEEATRRFSGPKVRFSTASVLNIPLTDSSIDTLISMETLEHLETPSAAVREFRRVLKKDGLLIGSVPSAAFEAKCEKNYGPNIHHIQRFTINQLQELLSQEFSFVKLGISMVGISTLLYPYEAKLGRAGVDATAWLPEIEQPIDGSIHFAASNVAGKVEDVFSRTNCWHAMSFIDYQASEVVPLRNAYKQCEALVYLKDQHLMEAAEALRAKDSELARLRLFNPFWVFRRLFKGRD